MVRITLLSLLISFMVTSIGYSQHDSLYRKSSILAGVSLWGQKKSVKYDSYEGKGLWIEADIKFGYFISNSYLINFQLETTTERYKSLTSSYTNWDISNQIVVDLRKYISNEIYVGAFGGIDTDYFMYLTSSKTKYWDVDWKVGFEIGYTLFLKPNIGIDFNTFYAFHNSTKDREELIGYSHSQFGLRIGFIYIFNNL